MTASGVELLFVVITELQWSVCMSPRVSPAAVDGGPEAVECLLFNIRLGRLPRQL